MDIYRDGKRRGICPPLFTDPDGDSCFSIYQIRWIKKRFFNFFFRNFRETTRYFSLRSQNSEYPRIFRVMGANQNARKLLSTDLVNTKRKYPPLGNHHLVVACALPPPPPSSFARSKLRFDDPLIPPRKRLIAELKPDGTVTSWPN